MKFDEKIKAIQLRNEGASINEIASKLDVAKSSVSVWVRHIKLTDVQLGRVSSKGHTLRTIEMRRESRLANELAKRQKVILQAYNEIKSISAKELWLMGVMLYWAEGGKTQRMVRFSNGDPEMIKIMMSFFRTICEVPEHKFRGHIHIHPHLDHTKAELYWSGITNIPNGQLFKTYRKQNISSKNKKDTLPYGVFDIYVLDTQLFLKITGWAKAVFHITN